MGIFSETVNGELSSSPRSSVELWLDGLDDSDCELWLRLAVLPSTSFRWLWERSRVAGLRVARETLSAFVKGLRDGSVVYERPADK